jgi:hypothetical protein
VVVVGVVGHVDDVDDAAGVVGVVVAGAVVVDVLLVWRVDVAPVDLFVGDGAAGVAVHLVV